MKNVQSGVLELAEGEEKSKDCDWVSTHNKHFIRIKIFIILN